jgi:hypothetical protein
MAVPLFMQATRALQEAEERKRDKTEHQAGTSSTPAVPSAALSGAEQAVVEAQVELMRARADVDSAEARVKEVAGRQARLLEQVVDVIRTDAAVGGWGSAAGDGHPAAGSRPAAHADQATPRPSGGTTCTCPANTVPASNPLQQAFEAMQKQAAAAAADTRAQQLRAEADQLAQKANAAEQEMEDLPATIDKNGSQYKKKKAFVLEMQAKAANADALASEAAEAAEVVHQEAAAVQHDLECAVVNAQAAEHTKQVAFEAAIAAARDVKKEEQQLQAQLEETSR